MVRRRSTGRASTSILEPVTVDGANNGTPRGTTYLNIYSPNVDSVAEFRVQTNSMAAEFGRSNGGSITMVTKSGTNRFTAETFLFDRDHRFNATNPFGARGADATPLQVLEGRLHLRELNVELPQPSRILRTQIAAQQIPALAAPYLPQFVGAQPEAKGLLIDRLPR